MSSENSPSAEESRPGEKKERLFTKEQLIRLIWPLMIEQFLAILVGMLDTVMISGEGEAAISGVSLVDNINILVINFMAALGTGGAVIAGHYRGQKNPKASGRAAWQLIYFAFFFSIVLVILLLTFHRSVLTLVFGQVDDDVMTAARTYLIITGISIVPLAVYNSCAGLFRAMDDSRTTMLVSLLMNLMNLCGNALLIYVFRMGVAGAAISTVISRTVSALLLFVFLFNPEKLINIHGQVTLKPDFPLLKKILYMGIPNGLENSIFQLGKILLLSLIATFGTTALAANSVAGNLAGFCLLPSGAINLAIVSVSSVCIGAGDIEQTRYYTDRLCFASEICMCVICTVIWFACPLACRLYSLTPETEQLALFVTRSHCIMAVIAWIPSFSVCNTLRSAGDVIRTMCTAIVSMWVFRIGSAYFMENLFHFGLMSVWGAMYIDWVFRGICFVVRYHGHGWENLLFKKQPARHA